MTTGDTKGRSDLQLPPRVSLPSSSASFLFVEEDDAMAIAASSTPDVVEEVGVEVEEEVGIPPFVGVTPVIVATTEGRYGEPTDGRFEIDGDRGKDEVEDGAEEEDPSFS
jgi:hypothetical protein